MSTWNYRVIEFGTPPFTEKPNEPWRAFHEVYCLSLANQECFAQALLSPPQPAPALERAFVRRRKLLRIE